MGLGGCESGSYRYLADKGVREEAAGKNCRVFIMDTNIKQLYRSREDGGS